jgi:hypothetical protein
MNLLRNIALLGGLMLTRAAHPTPFPLALETPRETSGTTFNPYRRGTAAAQRAALKKRNKQRSKRK